LNHGLPLLKPDLFRGPKMRERHQLFFGLWLESKEFQHPTIQTKIEQHFGGFFSKVRQPTRRQDSMPTEQAGGWIYFKISTTEI
jgi:hypothetical protein